MRCKERHRGVGGLRRRLPGAVALGTAMLGWLLLAVAGCGGGTSYELAPVSGKVTLDGKPAPNVNVSFQPVASGTAAPGPGSSGLTDSEGRYTLKTAEQKPRAGAVVGKHVVKFATSPERAPDDDTAQPKAKEPIAPKYRVEGVPFEVPKGGSTSADFTLDSGGPSSGPAARVDTGS